MHAFGGTEMSIVVRIGKAIKIYHFSFDMQESEFNEKKEKRKRMFIMIVPFCVGFVK